MAYLSLVLLSLACFAGDVVELEPVGYTDNFLCSQYALIADCNNAAGSTPAARAYCYWNGTKCVDDPNLRVLAAGDETAEGTCRTPSETVPSHIVNLTDYIDADCKESKGTGIICTKDTVTASIFNYCVYAWLRDNACPASVCVRNTDSSYAGNARNQCWPSNHQQCNMLSTSTECGLNPKCFWISSSCQTDPCWATGPIASPNTCEGLSVRLPLAGADTTNECKKFQPWISGEQKDYCVHKSQTNPNICYFGTPGATDSKTNTDFDSSFPTFNTTTDVGSVTCTGSVASCTGGECYTTINTGGAFAGQYCTDGTHGSANILSIPSMLVFLVMSALSFFIL